MVHQLEKLKLFDLIIGIPSHDAAESASSSPQEYQQECFEHPSAFEQELEYNLPLSQSSASDQECEKDLVADDDLIDISDKSILCDFSFDSHLYSWLTLLYTRRIPVKTVNEIINLCLLSGLDLRVRNYKDMVNLIDEIPLDVYYNEYCMKVNKFEFTLFGTELKSCILSFFQDKLLCSVMKLKATARFDDDGSRVYSDFSDTNWWMEEQLKFPPDDIIVPLIINSDATQMNKSGRAKAHPVYLTIGNIPRKWRAQANLVGIKLLGLLPTFNSSNFPKQSLYGEIKRVVYHQSIAILLDGLEQLHRDGLVVTDALNRTYRIRPILAMYSGDYEEIAQRVCLLKSGSACPTCLTSSSLWGVYLDHSDIQVRNIQGQTQRNDVHVDCLNFFGSLPGVDIYQCVPPDELHGICQGVFMHLFEGLQQWISSMLKPKVEFELLQEISLAFSKLSKTDINIVFRNGIFDLSNVTAKEHLLLLKELPVVLMMCLPKFFSRKKLWFPYAEPFLLLAHWYMLISPKTCSDRNLAASEVVLRQFFFSSLVYLAGRKIYKLHSMLHYTLFIRKFGSIAVMSTQSFEHAHKRFIKDIEAMTNHRQQLPQMLTRLGRLQKLEYVERIQTPVEAAGDATIENRTFVNLQSKVSQCRLHQLDHVSGIPRLAESIRDALSSVDLPDDTQVVLFSTIVREFTVPGDDVVSLEYIRRKDSFYGFEVHDYVAAYNSQQSNDIVIGKFEIGLTVQCAAGVIDLVICRLCKPHVASDSIPLQLVRLTTDVIVIPLTLVVKKVQICEVGGMYAINPFSDQLSFCLFFRQ
ncbi:hypothetical protein MIR68_007956 [Amoeboaphelidium protococcarum]|nr:hypothetical protein MIR68_007956 [Amoeboaphelidium protococcarum]